MKQAAPYIRSAFIIVLHNTALLGLQQQTGLPLLSWWALSHHFPKFPHRVTKELITSETTAWGLFGTLDASLDRTWEWMNHSCRRVVWKLVKDCHHPQGTLLFWLPRNVVCISSKFEPSPDAHLLITQPGVAQHQGLIFLGTPHWLCQSSQHNSPQILAGAYHHLLDSANKASLTDFEDFLWL